MLTTFHVIYHKSQEVAAVFTTFKEQVGDEASPAGLVARAQTSTVVTVKVFVEQQQVAPVWVLLELLHVAMYGPVSLFVAQENVRQAVREVACHLFQRLEVTRTRWKLYLEIVAVEVRGCAARQ